MGEHFWMLLGGIGLIIGVSRGLLPDFAKKLEASIYARNDDEESRLDGLQEDEEQA